MYLTNKENRILELTNVTCQENNYQLPKSQLKYETFCCYYSLGKQELIGQEAQNYDINFVIMITLKDPFIRTKKMVF